MYNSLINKNLHLIPLFFSGERGSLFWKEGFFYVFFFSFLSLIYIDFWKKKKKKKVNWYLLVFIARALISGTTHLMLQIKF